MKVTISIFMVLYLTFVIYDTVSRALGLYPGGKTRFEEAVVEKYFAHLCLNENIGEAAVVLVGFGDDNHNVFQKGRSFYWY